MLRDVVEVGVMARVMAEGGGSSCGMINLDKLLNVHSPALRDALHDSVQSSLSASQLQDIVVTVDDVFQAIRLLKKGKSDDLGLFSEHLKYAGLAIADSLASFLTACLKHGFLP